MPIPGQTEMFGIALELMGDGEHYSRKSLKEKARVSLKLTDTEANEKTSSGVFVYESRVGWAISYLSRAQLIDRVSRGVYLINESGRDILGKKLSSEEMWRTLNERIYALDPWNKGADSKKKKGGIANDADQAPVETVSPQEQISSLADELNASLADELLSMVLDHDPAFFERLVVDLLEKMGYGHGDVTQYSSDGGIDGLVTTDELGFRPILTQAKRYARDHSVGRPEVQSFVGALNGASNGVFITTSTFTKEAINYANGYPNATLALIDGHRLAELMIKYDLGVATERVLSIKRIDSDYFE